MKSKKLFLIFFQRNILQNNNINISVIGLGYVGLPLAIELAKKFKVQAFDINSNRIIELRKSKDKNNETKTNEIKKIQKRINFTYQIKDLTKSNFYIITVPTPINKDKQPDLEHLEEASKTIGSILKKGDIVIYESTVYPGATEEICVPELIKNSNLIFNKDFFVGYSPERINPGDKSHRLTDITKVTSGSTPEAAAFVDDLYSSIITAGTYKASSIKVAEAAKVIENTQRDVNIGLINELAIIFNKLSIDTEEVLKAAGTKWNFLPFSPGLVGGHCIGVDPYYLSYKSQSLGYEPEIILAGRRINDGMSKYVALQLEKKMTKKNILIQDSNILIMGVTFKEDCPDTRNTRVIDIIKDLKDAGAKIDVYDPWIKQEEKNNDFKIIENPFKSTKKYDAIIVAVSHQIFKTYTDEDYSRISTDSKVIIDIKNIVDNPSWRL